MTNHECGIDCKLETTPTGGKAHVMYANLPSSAAGRYAWEGNARIFRQGRGARAAWRKTGQDQTRECRVWEEQRRAEYAIFGRMHPRGRRDVRKGFID